MKKLFVIFIFISSLLCYSPTISRSYTIFIEDSLKGYKSELDRNNDSIIDGMDMYLNTRGQIGDINDYTQEEIDRKKKQQLLLRIALIIGVITAIIYSIFSLVNKYKKNLSLETQVAIPPHVKALNKLQNLKKLRLWQKGELKEYYSKLSLILREYTEHRFNFLALELPTSEIISNLKQLDPEILSRLELILQKADNIKYSKGNSLDKENKESMKKAEEFIQLSKIDKDESSK